MFSLTNQPQLSTRTSFHENPYTFEERHALLSEPFLPVVRHAPPSEPQYEPTYNIYSSLQHESNRTRHPNQKQNQISTIDGQIVHTR